MHESFKKQKRGQPLYFKGVEFSPSKEIRYLRLKFRELIQQVQISRNPCYKI